MKELQKYQDLVNTSIEKRLKSSLTAPKLGEACAYALRSGGKRLRPAIALMVADALANGLRVDTAALAVELFHTASLVADDLPCMDDDAERRNQPATHAAFGEAAALLVSYALIADGFRCLHDCCAELTASSPERSAEWNAACVKVLENASINTGIYGAVGGQLLDLETPDLSLETLLQVIRLKTGTLFELAFVTGWLFGGGDPAKLDLVKEAAMDFGVAFQIADDFDDIEQDIANERSVNIPGVFGKQEGARIFEQYLQRYRDGIQELEIDSAPLRELADLLAEKVHSLRCHLIGP